MKIYNNQSPTKISPFFQVSRRFSQETLNLHDHLRIYANNHRLSLANLKSTESFRPDLLRPDSFAISELRSRRYLPNEMINKPPPSTPREKMRATKKTISYVFGLCYEIFLVVFALCVFIGDSMIELYPVPQIFCIICIFTGLFYLIFLYFRIRKAVLKNVELAENDEFGEVDHSDHRYCFVAGRHGQLFYLKIGAMVFCLGSVIHSCLLLSFQIVFLFSDNPDTYRCQSNITLTLDIIFPIYSLFILFFLFKYANVVISEFRGIARIGIMHNIGTVLAMWIYTIVRETRDAIFIKQNPGFGTDTDEGDPPAFSWGEQELPLIACPGAEFLDKVFRNLSPYLYPFTIEFCIVAAGIFFMIWGNVGRCQKDVKIEDNLEMKSQKDNADGDAESENNKCFNIHEMIPQATSVMQTQQQPESSGFNSRSGSVPSLVKLQQQHEPSNRHGNIIYVDCHAANRGIFAAMILLVCTIVIIIILFIVQKESK